MFDKIKKPKLFIFSLAMFLFFAGAWGFGYIAGMDSSVKGLEDIQIENEDFTNQDGNRFYRSADMIDFSGIAFTPWTVKAESSNIDKREKKPYTIMIYMNGSDLESEMGFATNDIIEMQKSGVDSSNVNIVLFTGGTNRWKNDVIPSNQCVIWEIANGRLHRIADAGLLNMGDAGTLSGFIDFAARNFPADKYGLIMWDHGGGSIAGFGHDEKFNHSYLTLLDMNYAFEKSSIAEKKLEFLGFDSCLMATVEMAVVASDYARFLVASEDIEPYEGWNYGFLSVLNDNPDINGDALGKAIVDSFMEHYTDASGQSLALSVIDLSKAGRVMGALGALMKRCSDHLFTGSTASFHTLAAKRNGTKTFGVGSSRDNECDMVDIGDMANNLSDLFPKEAANILSELDNCIVYNRHNSNVDLKGLSAYYIYGGKNSGSMSLNMYGALNMNGDYTGYLNDFYSMLKKNDAFYLGRSSGRSAQDAPVGTELTLWQRFDGKPDAYIMTGTQKIADTNIGEMLKTGMNTLWPKINEKNVCLNQINSTNDSSLYAVPAQLNGKDCDIIITFSESHPHGKILGARQEDGFVIQKGYDDISQGDKIAFYYYKKIHGENDIIWYKDEEFTVSENLQLDWSEPEDESYYSIKSTDVRLGEHFTDLKVMQQ